MPKLLTLIRVLLGSTGTKAGKEYLPYEWSYGHFESPDA